MFQNLNTVNSNPISKKIAKPFIKKNWFHTRKTFSATFYKWEYILGELADDFQRSATKELKNIQYTWIWNNVMNNKVSPNGKFHEIFYNGNKRLFRIDNLCLFANNASIKTRLFFLTSCYSDSYIFVKYSSVSFKI